MLHGAYLRYDIHTFVFTVYIGYSSNYDEWKYEDELVEEDGGPSESQATYLPYSLFHNLKGRCGEKIYSLQTS